LFVRVEKQEPKKIWATSKTSTTFYMFLKVSLIFQNKLVNQFSRSFDPAFLGNYQ